MVDGVLVFAERPVAVLHTAGHIDQQLHSHVGFFFELLNVQSVLPRPHLPIDVTQVVAGMVLAMLQELDRLPEVWAAMAAGHEAFHDVLGSQIQSLDSLDRFRMQKVFGIGHRWSIHLL